LRIETSHEDDDDEDYNCNVFESRACLAGLDLSVLKILHKTQASREALF
jgi:hypothetical protein